MKNTGRYILFCIVLLAVLTRMYYAWSHRDRLDSLVISDMRAYDRLAKNLVEKNIYGFQNGPWPWRSYRPPLYPFFLSLVYRTAGYRLIAVRLAQAFLAGLSCFLLYLLARELAGVTTALIASLIFAVDFSLIHLSGLLLSENLYLPLSLIVILFLIRGFRVGDRSLFIGAGVAGGLAALCRPTILPFLILSFLAALILKRPRRCLAGWGLMLLFAAASIAPWTARNYRIHRAFIPISTNAGTMLWMGLHHGANGGYDWPRENNPLQEVTNEVERNRHGISESVKFILNYPREFLDLSVTKMKLFWGGYLFTWSGRQWAVIVLLGLGGLVVSLKEWRRWSILYLYLLTFTGLHFFVHSGARYRLPLHPLVEIWAATFIIRLGAILRKLIKRRRL